jgi:hypothetical protein
MKRVLPILLFAVFVSLTSYAQGTRSVRGNVKDTTGAPIQKVYVKLLSGTDNLTTSTDAKGDFVFPSVKSSKFHITILLIGFETFAKDYSFTNDNKAVVLDPIKLKEAVNMLEAVTIVGVVPVKVAEDTVEYSPPAVREGDAVEEVLKKLPGIVVDKDGNVTTEGKPITKIRVNGKDFFGGDVATAIQNLPAEVIQSLQIIDDYGDEAKLTGIKSEEPTKVLNIKIRPDKNKGYFVNGSIGKGNEGRYSGSLRGNALRGDRQISYESFLGNVNSRGGGGGSGITDTKSVGLNYRDKWGKKVSVDGSYNFALRDNNTLGSTFTQRPAQLFNQNQNSNSGNNNLSHTFFMNLEYNIDTLNFLKISPNISYNSQDNNSIGNTITTVLHESSVRANNSSNSSSSPNYGGNFYYNHKFLKKGRNFTLTGNMNYSSSEQDRDAYNNTVTKKDSLNTTTNLVDTVVTNLLTNQFIGTDNINKRSGFRLSYNEPVTASSFISFNYSLNNSHTESVRDVYDNILNVFDPALSNNYNYTFVTNRAGLNYRVVKKAYNYTVGIAAQPVSLNGYDISRNINTTNKTFNWVPNARFVYKFDGNEGKLKNTLTINYNGRSNQPAFNQLQNIVDNSNPQNIVTGNPDLKPEFINSADIQFNQNNNKNGYLMFTNLQYSNTKDKIVTVTTLDGTTQKITYTNSEGFYNLSGNYSFTKPFAERKYQLTYSGRAYYNNYVTFTNFERNLARNFSVNQGFRFRFDLKDVMDADLNGSYTVTTTQYSSLLSQDQNVKTMRVGLNGRNYFFKDLTLGYDFSKTINRGYIGFSQDPLLLNLFMEYRFLKGNMGRLRLQGYDLFNQNTGISSTITGDQRIDSQYNQLARYFLLSFNLQIRKFAGGMSSNANRQNGNNGQGPRPGGNQGGGGFNGGR